MSGFPSWPEVAPEIEISPEFSLGTILKPLEETTLTVSFDPQTSGRHEALLQIQTNGLGPDPEILITGLAQSPHADLRIEMENNNLGGAALGDSTTQLVTLQNMGLQELQISDLRFVTDARADQFSISGLPVDFPSDSIVIAPGETQTVTLEFAPAQTGLQPGVLEVLSNDPDTPIATQSVVGTGLAPDPLSELDWGNDYVALETPRVSGSPILRDQTDDGGNWSFVVPPEESIRYAIFDPVSGLIAHGLQLSAESGADTDPLTPQFDASMAQRQ